MNTYQKKKKKLPGYLLILALALFSMVSTTTGQVQEGERYASYFTQRQKITLNGAGVRKYWGLINVGGGVIGAFSTTGSNQNFFLMNALIGGANLLISGEMRRSVQNPVYQEELMILQTEQRAIERNHLFAFGIDFVITAGGYAMVNQSGNAGLNKERLEGYGYSLLLQGGSMMIFDAFMYLLHRKNRKANMKLLLEQDGYVP